MLHLLLVIILFCQCNSEVSNGTSTHQLAKISTEFGDLYFELYDETPKHKAMFVKLANEQHYDQFTINRVIKDFVIQGGCPDSVKFFKDSPYLLKPEFSDSIKHKFGALGMGRDDNPDKLSNGCQFYIVTNEDGLPRLDGEYMIFGEMVSGVTTLKSIEALETDTTDTPLESVTFTVSIVDVTAQELKML